MRSVQTFLITLAVLTSLVSAIPGRAQSSKHIYTGMFGVWGYENIDTALQILKDNGFDLAIVGPDHIANVHRKGLKAIVSFDLKKDVAQDEVKWKQFLSMVKKNVIQYKSHPAVFAWYVVDEPDLQSISLSRVITIRNMIRSIDKDTPLFTVLTLANNWSSYLAYFDIIAIDPYLKNDETPDKVRNWVNGVRNELRLANTNKSIWVVLGAFELRPKVSGAPQYGFKKISPDEFREMVSVALTASADAILVYTLAFKDKPFYMDWKLPDDDPDLWEVVKRVPKLVR